MALYYLMNGDDKVLEFDLDELYIHVERNDLLPFSLKDFIADTNFSDKESSKKSLICIEKIKEFIMSRILLFSRENATSILRSAGFSRLGRINNEIDIALKCNCPNVKDSFWIKEADSSLYFFEVNLRNNLENEPDELSYDIAVMGEIVKTDYKRLIFDMTTGGMSPKYWKMTGGGLELWKTDSLNGVKPRVEVNSSYYINYAGGNSVDYTEWVKDGLVFSSCKNMASDDKSLIHGQDVIDWLDNKNVNREDFIKGNCLKDFANMCVADFVLANTDRHNENWGFIVNKETNEIEKLSPLFDFNQALVADGYRIDIKDVVYPPTEKTMIETVNEYSKYATIDFGNMKSLPKKCKERWNIIQDIKMRTA